MRKLLVLLLFVTSSAHAQGYNIPFVPRAAGGGGSGNIIWSEDFNAAADDGACTSGTCDDNCTTGSCPRAGAQSLSLGPSLNWDRWIKDGAFANRQTACMSFTLYVESPATGALRTFFYLRTDSNDTDRYAMKLDPELAGSDDWAVYCNDIADPARGGDYVDDTSYAVVLDIDMASGDMDLYIDGASTATVACDGAADAETFDGVKFLAGQDETMHIIYDDAVICDNATVAGVCACT